MKNKHTTWLQSTVRGALIADPEAREAFAELTDRLRFASGMNERYLELLLVQGEISQAVGEACGALVGDTVSAIVLEHLETVNEQLAECRLDNKNLRESNARLTAQLLESGKRED